MRTSTTFLIFGVIVLGYMIFSLSSERRAAEKPQLLLARTFLDSVKNHDIETLQKITDPETTQIISTGGKITAINFKEMAMFEGVFSRVTASNMTYIGLTDIAIPPKTQPVVLDSSNLAFVQLNRRNKIYMRQQTDGEWKIFYVSKPGTDKLKKKNL